MNQIDIQKLVKHWQTGSATDWKLSLSLYKQKYYAQACFFIHLSLEKNLKAIVVKKTKQHASYSDKLSYLAGLASVSLEKEHLEWLDTITSFNLSGRYPDEKQQFKKTLMAKETSAWQKKAKLLHQIFDKSL